MKKVVLYISFIALVISGCTKELSHPKESNTLGKSQITIYASINDTKTTVDGTGIFSWQDSEEISLVETDYYDKGGIDFTLADAESGAFSGILTAGKSPVFAVSPKGILGDAYEESGDVLYDLTLPASYSDYVPGTSNAVMIGEPNGKSGDNYKFTFYQATALLKITYVNVPIGTKKLVLGSTETALTGKWTLDSTSEVYLSEASASSKGYEVTLDLKDEVKIANLTLVFYVPVPVANYKDFVVELRDSGNSVITGTSKSKDGLNITLRAGDILPLPAISLTPVTAADAYSYTFTAKVYSSTGAQTLNSRTWTLAGTGTSPGFAYDGTKGQQFGTQSNPFSSLSLTSASFSPKGVRSVKVNASGAKDIVGAISVKVGDVYFLCGGVSSKTITNTATDYIFECPDGGMVPGAVAIELSQTSSKGMYIKSIAVNPVFQVATPEISITSNTATITCATAGASIYYTTDGTTPTSSSTLYTGPFSVAAKATVKAIATKADYTNSEIASKKNATIITYAFKDISGFSSWTSSYSSHSVDYTEATVTFTSHSKQTGTITDIPVGKGAAVTLVLKDSKKSMPSVQFNCRQWSDKAQTITLHYSTDSGDTYTTTGVTSTNFKISKDDLASGTNAVKITFSSSSNQVGIESVSFEYE